MKSLVKAPTSPAVSKREQNNRKLARIAADEGIVLLKNNGVLPLKNKEVSLFGGGARRTITGGTGSGAMHERYSVSIEEGLLAAGFDIDSKGWLDKYDRFFEETYSQWHDAIEELVQGITHPMAALQLKKQHEFQYPTGMEIMEDDLAETTAQTAIYVIARQSGEADDRKLAKGDYYLDDVELDNLTKLVNHYQNVIVVINSGSSINLSFMDSLEISGLIFYSQAGEEGGNAFADVVSGKVSPSGKLTNTWAKKYADYPSAGYFSTESDPLQQDYVEGIYVGYRYFDSFEVEPQYAFGFGLTYSDFEIEQNEIVQDEESIRQKLTVKNCGTTKAKEVIQTYVTVPFSIEGTEQQRLVAFAKTKELQSGEEQELELVFQLKALTQYNEQQAAYELLAGDYIVRTGNSSRDTAAVGYLQVAETVTTEVCTNINPLIREFRMLVPPIRSAEKNMHLPIVNVEVQKDPIVHEYKELPVYTDTTISNIIEVMPLEDLATLVVGGGITGDRIVNVLGASGSTTSKLYEKYGIPNIILSDGPAGLNVTPELVQLPSGEVKSTHLYEQYNFGAFRDFMMQRIGNPEDGQMHYQYATAWPASVLLAQTWNLTLLEEVGYAAGEEMEEFGVTIWLAPGMNIQRNPLGGRSFEYYSEDPFLSGMMAAAITNGVQQHEGKGMSVKHFCANNSEVLRDKSSSNMNERTLREIYLKGFEIALAQSNPRTVMASYNKVNGIYNTNNHDLLVKVLRNEWSYEGLVMSDWESLHEEKGDILKAHQAQCDLVTPGTPQQVHDLIAGIETGQVDIRDLKRSAARILGLITQNTALRFEPIEIK